MKISELITELKKAKSELGDIEIVTSSDSEGNSFGRINKNYFSGNGKIEGKEVFIIYPNDDYLELDYDQEELDSFLHD